MIGDDLAFLGIEQTIALLEAGDQAFDRLAEVLYGRGIGAPARREEGGFVDEGRQIERVKLVDEDDRRGPGARPLGGVPCVANTAAEIGAGVAGSRNCGGAMRFGRQLSAKPPRRSAGPAQGRR